MTKSIKVADEDTDDTSVTAEGSKRDSVVDAVGVDQIKPREDYLNMASNQMESSKLSAYKLGADKEIREKRPTKSTHGEHGEREHACSAVPGSFPMDDSE